MNLADRWIGTVTALIGIASCHPQSPQVPSNLRSAPVGGHSSDHALAPVGPCSVAELEVENVPERLRQLNAAIEASADDDDVSSLAHEIESLGKSRCYRLIGGVVVGSPSAPALRAFWSGGGWAWASQVLDPAAWTEISLPPRVARTLSRQAMPALFDAGMICAPRDDKCVAASSAWLWRLSRTLSGWAANASIDLELPPAWPACRSWLVERGRGEGTEFDRWASCATAAVAPEYVVPIGAVRRPEHGVVVFRAAERACSRVRVYDLDESIAYQVNNCESGKWQGSAGTISRDVLSEAIWTLLTMDFVEQGSPAVALKVPSDIPLTTERANLPQPLESYAMVSTQVRYDWAYVVGGHLIRSGKVRHPAIADARAAYVSLAFEVADRASVSACSAASMTQLDKLAESVSDAGFAVPRANLVSCAADWPSPWSPNRKPVR